MELVQDVTAKEQRRRLLGVIDSRQAAACSATV